MIDSLKILHILETYPPDYGGGAAVTTREICRALADAGHEVRVLCSGNTEEPPYAIRTEQDGDVRVDRVNLPYFKTTDPDGWQMSLRGWREHEERIGQIIDKFLDDWTPDIIDYHTARPFGEECLLTIARRGIPLTATLHEGWLVCPRLMLLRSPDSQPCAGPGPMKCLECMYSHYDGSRLRAAAKLPWRLIKLGAMPAYRISRRADARKGIRASIARSEFIARIHRPHINGNVQHIPLGIDLNGLPEDCPVRPHSPIRFGFFGGFQQTKGIWHLLEASESLRRKGFAFELHIWGPGQDRGENSGEREIEARNLQNSVFLRGMYLAKDRWEAYNEIDVAVMATTVCEPLGRIPMEAAAVGAPTIAPAIGGITETIRDGVDGLLYEFRNPRDLEQKMQSLIEDAGLFNKLAKNLPPALDTKDSVSAVEEFYFSALGRARARLAVV